MAIKKQYALLDTQIKAFLNAFSATTDAEAIRLFTTWVNDDKNETNINKYPQHFSLYYMGDYDDQFGTWIQERDGKSIKKELIIGMSVKEDMDKKFTIAELIQMLKAELQTENIIEIPVHEQTK